MPTARSRTATAVIAGVLLYAAIDAILQFLPPHYSPIRDAESDLAVGPFGWIQFINYLGRGVTCALAIVAIAGATPGRGTHPRRRMAGLVLLAVTGICGALVAFFPTDIVAGGQARTVHGHVHVVAASIGFTAALSSFWTLRGVIRSRASDAWLIVATIGLAFLAATIAWVPAVFGLAERICLIGILGWLFATALTLRRLERLP